MCPCRCGLKKKKNRSFTNLTRLTREHRRPIPGKHWTRCSSSFRKQTNNTRKKRTAKKKGEHFFFLNLLLLLPFFLVSPFMWRLCRPHFFGFCFPSPTSFFFLLRIIYYIVSFCLYVCCLFLFFLRVPPSPKLCSRDD